MGNMVMLSGLSMLYQIQRFPRFWATTTSLPGTHCTYEQKLSSVALVPLSRSYRWSWGGAEGRRGTFDTFISRIFQTI